MPEQLYRIMFNGGLLPGRDQAEVQQRLAHVLKLTDQARDMLFSGRPMVKRNLTRDKAEYFSTLFQQAGAKLFVQPEQEPQAAAPAQAAPPAAALSTPGTHVPSPPPPPPASPVRAQAPAAPPAAPPRSAQVSAAAVSSPASPASDATMECPKCSRVQPKADECAFCGVIVSKAAAPSAAGPPMRPQPATVGQVSTARESPKGSGGGGIFAPEKKGIQAGVVGGLVMMAIAVVWFVLGMKAGIIFYYPPILFVIGVYGFFKGLVQGNLSG